MSSIRNIASANPVPLDLAKKIGISGVNEILLTFWQGYEDLKKDTKIVITPTSEEDDITQAWFVEIQRRWDSRNRATCVALNKVVPIHQYGDSTLKKRRGVKSPTIDFSFKDWESSSYFGAECKNLYKNRTDKVSRYIETGIKHYTSGRYGAQSSESAMIGYVLSGDIPTLVDELAKGIQKELPISNMVRNMSFSEPQYKTSHIRFSDDVEITLHHLFFNFVA